MDDRYNKSALRKNQKTVESDFKDLNDIIERILRP